MYAAFESQILPRLAECAADEIRSNLSAEAKSQQEKDEAELRREQDALELRRKQAIEMKRHAEASVQRTSHEVRVALVALKEKQNLEVREACEHAAAAALKKALSMAHGEIEEHKQARLSELRGMFQGVQSKTHADLVSSVLNAKTVDEAEKLLFDDTLPNPSASAKLAKEQITSDVAAGSTETSMQLSLLPSMLASSLLSFPSMFMSQDESQLENMAKGAASSLLSSPSMSMSRAESQTKGDHSSDKSTSSGITILEGESSNEKKNTDTTKESTKEEIETATDHEHSFYSFLRVARHLTSSSGAQHSQPANTNKSSGVADQAPLPLPFLTISLREQWEEAARLQAQHALLVASLQKTPVLRQSYRDCLTEGLALECTTLVAESRSVTAEITGEWAEKAEALCVSYLADIEAQCRGCERDLDGLRAAIGKARDSATLRSAMEEWVETGDAERLRSFESRRARAKARREEELEKREALSAAELRSVTKAVAALSCGVDDIERQKIGDKLRKLEARELEARKLALADSATSGAGPKFGPRTLVNVQPTGSHLPPNAGIPVHIVLDEDFGSWTQERQRRLVAEVKRLLGVTIDIKQVRAGSVVVDAHVLNEVVDAQLRDVLADEDTRRALAQSLHCRLLIVGNYGLDLNSASGDILSPQFNKVYRRQQMSQSELESEAGPGATRAFWEGVLRDRHDRGNHPYYCPEGWTRFGINVGSKEEFDAKYSGWHVAYHGTKQGAVGGILRSTLRQGPRAAQGRAIYLTPSIAYAANPNYASYWTLRDGTEVQVVLQCRVQPAAIAARRPATVGRGRSSGIDPNFPDGELHWLVRPDGDDGLAAPDQLVCYGILVRKRPT